MLQKKHPTKIQKRKSTMFMQWNIYLIFCMFLVLGYSMYSLIYEDHKSWYSWILSSLVGTVYTFGFIMMTPQLFINYKLKSVAHLPWRTFMYKALNTFIDDLFAFIIKMPTLHRVACFRDDVVFFIFLYQRWIYPVDKKRKNEYGRSGEDTEHPPTTPTSVDSAALLTNPSSSTPDPTKTVTTPIPTKKTQWQHHQFLSCAFKIDYHFCLLINVWSLSEDKHQKDENPFECCLKNSGICLNIAEQIS